MHYREFLDLTDDEIKQIVTDIFAPVKIENIKRYKKWNYIAVKHLTKHNMMLSWKVSTKSMNQ